MPSLYGLLCLSVCQYVSPSVSVFNMLIGSGYSQWKSFEITRGCTISNTIYVYTDRKQCSYSTTVHSSLHRVGVKSESGSESRSNKEWFREGFKKNIFSFFHSVSNFLGIELISPWFLAVVHSDFLAWLTSATLIFLILTELCQTQIYYLDWAVPHSDFLTWLSTATLRFIILAEQCHTRIF